MSFHDVRFPVDIARGFSGGPAFSTRVLTSDSGYEQRVGLWVNARRSWQAAAGFWNDARLAMLISFFNQRKGSLYGFRWKDWADYTVAMTLVPGTGLAYSGTPHRFATGDGVVATFQLSKVYGTFGDSMAHTRKITRPVTGAVKIYFGATEQVSGWTLNYATGVVTFAVAPPNTTAIGWSGEFDVPARFDSDSMNLDFQAVRAGAWADVQVIELRE